MGSQKITATKVNDRTCTEAHVRHWRGVDLTAVHAEYYYFFFSFFSFFFCSHKPSAQTFVPVGDLSMSDQGVLPKLISNITSDLSRARDLPGPLSDVALHEARFYGIKDDGRFGLVFFPRPPRFTLLVHAVFKHGASPRFTCQHNRNISPAGSCRSLTGDCCCRGERHVPVTSRLLPLRLRLSPAKHRRTWVPRNNSQVPSKSPGARASTDHP